MFHKPRLAIVVCLCVMLVAIAGHAWAQQERQIGKAEVVNVAVGRFKELPRGVEETAPHGFLEMFKAPEGMSLVVLWLDLKITPGKDEDGDAMTVVPESKVKFTNEQKEDAVPVGHCSRDGRFQSSYSYGYSMYGAPQQETLPYSLVYVVKDGETKFKLRFGDTERDVEVPSQPEPTLDPTSAVTIKIAKAEVRDALERRERLGRYDKPIGEASLYVQGTSQRFLVLQLYVKGKASNSNSGGFQVRSSEFGVLYGSEVFMRPLGSLDGDDFEAGETFITSSQDVVGDFSTAAVRLVYPLPGRVTKFKLLYLMRPVAEMELPKSE